MRRRRVLALFLLGVVASIALLVGVPTRNKRGIERIVPARISLESEEYDIPDEYGITQDFWSTAAQPETAEILDSIDRGIRFFRSLQRGRKWDTPGGYVWAYSPDLTRRAERMEVTDGNVATCNQMGSTCVGNTYLIAFKATRNIEYLKAAEEVGFALIRNQLNSGGWAGVLFADAARMAEGDRYEECRQAHRDKEAAGASCARRRYDERLAGLPPGIFLRAMLKEKTTQDAIIFLIDLGEATGKGKFQAAARRGLGFLLAAQHSLGGWPARYPLDESENRGQDELIVNKLSFNDGATNAAVETLLKGYRAYGDQAFLDSAIRGADFMLQTQISGQAEFESPTGWAQQYDYRLKPSWGRGSLLHYPEEFKDIYKTADDKDGTMTEAVEPPCLIACSSADVALTLMRLYLETRDEKYLDCAARAMDWLGRSIIAAGTFTGFDHSAGYVAEYYELRSNRPLFIGRPRGQHHSLETSVRYAPDENSPAWMLQPIMKDIDGALVFNSALFPSIDTNKDVGRIMVAFGYLKERGRDIVLAERSEPPKARIETRLEELKPVVGEILMAQREDGSWPDHGENMRYARRYDESEMTWAQRGTGAITTSAFDRHVRTLAEYLMLVRFRDRADQFPVGRVPYVLLHVAQIGVWLQ